VRLEGNAVADSTPLKEIDNTAEDSMLQEEITLGHEHLVRVLIPYLQAIANSKRLVITMYVNIFIAKGKRIIRPDILIPSIGLELEVDGPIHTEEWKQLLDARQEHTAIDLHLWHDRVSEEEATNFPIRVLQRVRRLFDQSIRSKKDQAYFRTVLSRSRKRMSDEFKKQAGFDLVGKVKRFGVQTTRVYGGYKIELRPRRIKPGAAAPAQPRSTGPHSTRQKQTLKRKKS
jgi:hypothetical protein